VIFDFCNKSNSVVPIIAIAILVFLNSNHTKEVVVKHNIIYNMRKQATTYQHAIELF